MEQLLDALAKAASAMENPKFDSTNPHFKSKFASLAACEAVVRPRLAEQGLMYRQTCLADHEDGMTWLVTIVYGAGGEVEVSRVPLSITGNDPQKQGSALTYAKRYGLCAAFGIAGEEDDDGNAATERPQKPRKQPYKASIPQQVQSPATGAPMASHSDSDTITPAELDVLKQSFVNYRDAMGMTGNDALAKLLAETGIEQFGSNMTQREFQTAQIAMGKAIAQASGAKVVE